MPDDAKGPSLLEGLPVWVSDTNQAWPTLRIARSIPLSRLEWLWNSRGTSIRDSSTSARAVFEVSTERSPTVPVPLASPHDWYRNPCVYTLITTLKELESTKEQAWTRIRRFVEECRNKLHEYLIILAASDDELSSHKRTVEKLRTEINLTARGRERMVVVPPAVIREEQRPITHLHHSPAHQDLLVRLRECVREGAEARVQAYEEEVSRSYLNRTSTLWTFTQFFALKEGMAFIFVQLGRRDLAVRFYDELQVTMTERNECGAGGFCDEAAADAAMGVTDPDAKDYRSRLVANSISEIDMRTYLFSRQLSLLLMDRKFADVAERGLKFITAIARRCAEEALSSSGKASAVFRDTWVFTTARALAAALTPAIPSPSEANATMSVHLATPRERHTARLIAGFHVHALKAFLGLTCVTLPGCLAPENPHDKRDKAKIAEEAKSTSHERLREALSDSKQAEVLHSEIANAAASLYEMGGRARGAAALDGDAGVVRLRNSSFLEAESLLSAQCTRFINDNGWDNLHRRQRLELARAEKELDHIQEYLVSCLTMLYMSRSERQMWNRPFISTDNTTTEAEDAAHWAAETERVAGRLPRVMKYKAERLFEVLVLPRSEMWLEGDPGTATVRIVSDIPTTITIDSVLVECRSTSPSSSSQGKSALRQTETHNRSSETPFSEAESIAQDSTRNATTTAGEGLDVIVLRSKESIELARGLNDVQTYIDEIPKYGRYKVTVLALFLGNLKLVQLASKGPPTPIVTTKGSASGRNASLIGPPSSVSDYVKGEVKFPIFYAAKRDPSAHLVVEEVGPLHLAPGSIQFLRIKITAGQHGLAEGSRLTFSLLSTQRGRYCTSAQFVRFLESSDAITTHEEHGPSILAVKRLEQDHGRNWDAGDAAVEQSLDKGEVLERLLAIKLAPDCCDLQDRLMDGDSDARGCVLQLQLSCAERDSSTRRRFDCEVEKKLIFTCPVSISARIELNCEWGGEIVSRALGLDGTPLGDGGTLLCSVRNATHPERPISITEATLKLPPSLEMRPDEPPPHIELLPCCLRNGSVFTFAFDIQIRDETPDQRHYRDEGTRAGTVAFDKDAVEARLSRAIAKSTDMADSQDDISQWGMGRRMHSKSLMEAEGTLDEAGVAEVNVAMRGLEIDTESALENGESDVSKDVSQIIEETRLGPASTVKEEESRFDDQLDTIGVEEEYSASLKEAEDVVDLSASHGPTSQSRALISPSFCAESLAALTLDIKIEGLDSITTIERKICMSALRKAEKRYRVERSIKKIGESGKDMELQFSVRLLTLRRNGTSISSGVYGEVSSTEDSEELQYEIDADPTVWIVVGRRRGKVQVTSGLTTVRSAKIIPLAPGRQRVPCVRLFTADGGGLAFSRYENVNEYMQVAVVPQRTVVSACYLTNNGKNEAQGSYGKGNMPVVIASDSFFGN